MPNPFPMAVDGDFTVSLSSGSNPLESSFGQSRAAADDGNGSDLYYQISDIGIGPEPVDAPLLTIPADTQYFDLNLPLVPATQVEGRIHDPVSVVTFGSEIGVDGLVALDWETPAAQVIVNAGGENLTNTYVSPEDLPVVVALPDGSSPVQFGYVGVPGVGAAGVAVAPEAQTMQIFAGPTGDETMLNMVVSPDNLPFVTTLPNGTDPVQVVYLGAPSVGSVMVALNQEAQPGDPFAQVVVRPDGGAPILNQVINMPGFLGAGPESSSSSASASNDNLSFGSGMDSVVALGNATAAGLSEVGTSLGADSIISSVADPVGVDALGGSDAFSAQSSSSAFALGADSLAAVQAVSDFASAPAAAPVVTTVEDVSSAAGSLVSLDDGLTTIDVSGVTSKLPFGG